MRDTTLCWRCSAEYPASSLQCPACCAANANIDIDNACVEMAEVAATKGDWSKAKQALVEARLSIEDLVGSEQ